MKNEKISTEEACKYLDLFAQALEKFPILLDVKRKTYRCNVQKNIYCNKKYCYINGGPCKLTTDWNCAKRTPLNIIKKIFK